MFDKVVSMPPVLNIPGFWIGKYSEYVSGSEYPTVTQSLEYSWVILEYAWLCPDLSEYGWICQNMREYV